MNLEEAKKYHCACVYCLSFPNGKCYVGKTKDLCSRIGLYLKFGGSNKELLGAISEFGWDSIDISILSCVDCKDSVDLELCLSILEIKYIREIGSLSPNGYNISYGGECLGIPIEYLTTDADVIKRYSDGSKSILCYDLNGDFVTEYPSISRMAYEHGADENTIRNLIGKQKPFFDKYYLRFKRYDYIPNKIDVRTWEVRERIKYKDVIEERVVYRERTSYYIPALKYDMNGDFCGEYKNKSDACRSFLKNSTCDWGVYRNGYILFKKVDDNYPHKIEDYTVLSKKQLRDVYVPADQLEDMPNNCNSVVEFSESDGNKVALCVDGKYTNIKHQFKVCQLSLKGETIAVYDSIRDAALATGIRYSQIYNCLKGRTSKAAGYKWRIDDDANNPQFS